MLTITDKGGGGQANAEKADKGGGEGGQANADNY